MLWQKGLFSFSNSVFTINSHRFYFCGLLHIPPGFSTCGSETGSIDGLSISGSMWIQILNTGLFINLFKSYYFSWKMFTPSLKNYNSFILFFPQSSHCQLLHCANCSIKFNPLHFKFSVLYYLTPPFLFDPPWESIVSPFREPTLPNF